MQSNLLVAEQSIPVSPAISKGIVPDVVNLDDERKKIGTNPFNSSKPINDPILKKIEEIEKEMEKKVKETEQKLKTANNLVGGAWKNLENTRKMKKNLSYRLGFTSKGIDATETADEQVLETKKIIEI